MDWTFPLLADIFEESEVNSMMVERPAGSIANTLSSIQDAQAKTLQRVASGKQILSGADDPAGLAVSMALESQFRGLFQQIGNRQDEISLLQTAEGALGSTGDMVQRMRELSIQAANGTLTDEDRQNIQMEIGQLNEAIEMTANNTQYNTKPLLDGTFTIQLQNGNAFSLPNMGAQTLGTAGIDLTTQDSAQAAIGAADQALSTVTSTRSTIGAVSNGIAAEIQSLQDQYISAVAANSRIADVDIAREMVNLTTQNIQSQAAIKTFQVNDAMRQNVLKLLG